MKNELSRGNFNIGILQKQYLDYIDVADKTVETYDIAIRQFANYLSCKGIEKPIRDDVIAFREYLKAEHSVATVNSYLVALRNFFKFLEYNDLYKDITDNVKNLKDTNLHKREALSLEICQKISDNAKNLREKVIFMLTLVCGLRANEVVNIEINDLKYEEEQYRLYVLGKGRDDKTDYVIVPNNVVELIKEYVQEYNITGYLFVSTSHNNAGGKMTTRSIRRIVNEMFERVGVKRDTVVFHSLRHSFATISIENGQDIRDVSKALRHKSIATTETYLHDIEMRNNRCSNTVADLLQSKGV